MSEHLFHTVVGTVLGVILLRIWLKDLQTNKSLKVGEVNRYTLPGATAASRMSCLIASVGAIVIVIAISGIEKATGIADEQSKIPYYYLLPMLGAAITEEVIFRGYLIVRNRGKGLLVASACFFSLVFAAIHPYMWEHSVADPAGIGWITTLRLRLSTYAVVSTGSVAALSLWYYYVRFSGRNPTRSLLPCFCAHASANLTVFIIKLTAGYITTH